MAAVSGFAPGLRRLMADLWMNEQQSREQEATGWVVVTIDMWGKREQVTHTTGLFESPEQALVEVGVREREDARVREKYPDHTGWRYVVAPMFPPTERKP